jgi:histidine ammonia-lyase
MQCVTHQQLVSKMSTPTILLDGCSLHPTQLVDLGAPGATLELTPDAWAKVTRARAVVDKVVREKRTVYGINTGFGKFQSTKVDDVELLQVNLIRSHCAGVGKPLNAARARRLLALRINILSKGHSGIRPSTIKTMLAIFNSGCVPYIPEKGTVGASGDLAPLSHLAQGIMGEGRMATLEDLAWRPAKAVLAALGIAPVALKAKEGLSLINGTQFIVSLGCEALIRSRNIARQADVVCAMTTEALLGTKMAMDPLIHAARNHEGQGQVAARVRALLDSDRYPSTISASHKNCSRVQDAYSLRCAPQVHGVVCDTIKFVAGVLTREMNAATDNPVIFPDAVEEHRQIISGGNFHGEYPAKVLDMLGIAVCELGNISERRTERLNNPSISEMPAFLTARGGLESGFMIAHCTAAALVSENKVLSHPASVDTISTSAAQEDHVSMGGFAARKAIEIVANIEHVLAVELLCACQGIDFRRPNKSTAPLERVYDLVRTVVEPWTADRDVSVDIEAIANLLRDNKVWECVQEAVAPEDRFEFQPVSFALTSRL